MSFRLKILLFAFCFSLFSLLAGCDAFVRKFTRKPKKQEAPEELVLVPEEYKGLQMTREQLYRQYFLFWKSWQDELIEALSLNANHKKQINCAEEAIKNLLNLRPLVNKTNQKKLDTYILKMQELKSSITRDIYANTITTNRQNAERLKRNILRDFSYSKIRDS